MASGDIGSKFGSATSLTISGFNSLASTSFAESSALDFTSGTQLDAFVEIVVADVAEAGNKQVNIWAISSVDGTNYAHYSSNKANLAYVGSCQCNGSGAWRSQAFSIKQAFGGILPPLVKIVVENDMGVTLAGSGNTAQTRTEYKNVAA